MQYLQRAAAVASGPHLHSMWSIRCIDHIRHLVCIECVIFWYPIHTCYVWDQAVQQDFFFPVRLVHSLLKYFFQISVVILNSNLHYQIFNFVIDNSDISLNCLQHIQKRRNFDAKVTCHQPICLLLHAILSGVGVQWPWWQWTAIAIASNSDRRRRASGPERATPTPTQAHPLCSL